MMYCSLSRFLCQPPAEPTPLLTGRVRLSPAPPGGHGPSPTGTERGGKSTGGPRLICGRRDCGDRQRDVRGLGRTATGTVQSLSGWHCPILLLPQRCPQVLSPPWWHFPPSPSPFHPESIPNPHRCGVQGGEQRGFVLQGVQPVLAQLHHRAPALAAEPCSRPGVLRAAPQRGQRPHRRGAGARCHAGARRVGTSPSAHLMLRRGLVLCTWTSHIGQYLFVSR